MTHSSSSQWKVVQPLKVRAADEVRALVEMCDSVAVRIEAAAHCSFIMVPLVKESLLKAMELDACESMDCMVCKDTVNGETLLILSPMPGGVK